MDLPAVAASEAPGKNRALPRSTPQTLPIVFGRTAAALTVLAVSSVLALPAQAQDIEAGRQKAAEVCFACHGEDGNTPLDPSYPKLAGQYQDYLEHALLDYKNDRRKNPLMGPQAKLLSREEIRNVAAYYASLPGTITNRR